MENQEVLRDYLKYRLETDLRSESTVTNERHLITKLMKFLDGKPFKDVNKQDMIEFFKIISRESRDLYATKIILFYRHILNLKRRERPEIMEWFEYSTKRQRLKRLDPEAHEKSFITEKQYSKIMNTDLNNQEKALFETLYLSGARTGEVRSMTTKSVHEDGGIEIVVWQSKTVPRKIPLGEYPTHLMNWVKKYPESDTRIKEIKNDKGESLGKPLFYSMSKRDYGKPLSGWAVIFRLEQACIHAGIPRHKPKHFRSTRATIMFEQNVDDTRMAKFFGWQLETVSARRRQYDLRGYDDLKKFMFNGVEKPQEETVEDLKAQRDTDIMRLKRKNEQLNEEIEFIRKENREYQEKVDKFMEGVLSGKIKPPKKKE